MQRIPESEPDLKHRLWLSALEGPRRPKLVSDTRGICQAFPSLAHTRAMVISQDLTQNTGRRNVGVHPPRPIDSGAGVASPGHTANRSFIFIPTPALSLTLTFQIPFVPFGPLTICMKQCFLT